jgi:hypothetical protein
MDPDLFWRSVGGGALVAAAIALVRLILEFTVLGADRRSEVQDRRRRQQRDAEERLQRVLEDRLADADRRLDRYELDVHTERLRCATLEREHAHLLEAHEQLKQQYARLEAEHAATHQHPSVIDAPQ